MTTTPLPAQPGRLSALVVYTLYLLSIPSFALFALLGVIVAMAAREGAGPLARSHLDYQIRIWFSAFWWAVIIIIGSLIGWLLTPILVGFPILLIFWLASLAIFLWFTVVSFFGLLALLDGRPK
ncbi:MAG: hypothetical protein K2X34_06595 [Hyphomonadaceae bacterium]|nr:hypothetical protein [Hyphomonadaceae bacterium]